MAVWVEFLSTHTYEEYFIYGRPLYIVCRWGGGEKNWRASNFVEAVLARNEMRSLLFRLKGEDRPKIFIIEKGTVRCHLSTYCEKR